MNEPLFDLLVWIWILTGIIIFPLLLKVKAPYGRHSKGTWGPVLNSKAGWIIMEMPSLIIFACFFIFGKGQHSLTNWIFFSLWILHYGNRTLIFPFRLRTREKKMPLVIVLMGIFFNLINASFNGYYLGSIAPAYEDTWMLDPRFLGGLIVFFTGFVINQYADFKLIHLRKPGETGYKIPTGGLFEMISCPNHFGEIIEWTGFAIMVWNLPGLAFAVWTFVNLVPRAYHHHQWYRLTFDNYPRKRKAVIPFLV